MVPKGINSRGNLYSIVDQPLAIQFANRIHINNDNRGYSMHSLQERGGCPEESDNPNPTKNAYIGLQLIQSLHLDWAARW